MGYAKGGPLENYQLYAGVEDENFCEKMNYKSNLLLKLFFGKAENMKTEMFYDFIPSIMPILPDWG